MSAALSSRFPGVQVRSLRQTNFIDGTAQKIRFELDFAGPNSVAGAPASLWVKGGFDPKGAGQGDAFANEVRFFRDIAPLLPINRPDSYFGEVDPSSNNGVVLLEDLLLRGATFGRATEPLRPNQTAAVLSLQARYHAFFWESPKLDSFTWLKAGGAIADANVVEQYFGLWDAATPLPRFTHLTAKQREKPRVQAALEQLVRNLKRDACCFIHGDSGIPNIYFDAAGAPGYLDWQHAMRGHWAFDLAAFVITSLTVEDRQRNERALLTHYLSELAANGAEAPPFEDAWLAYRQFAMWPFMWVMCPPSVHPEEVCSALSERACAAIADLGSIDVLR
jgi:hypothetical protein